MTKAVAKAKKNEVANADGFDYGDDINTGFEDVTNDDLSIPFFNVLQSNSPEVEDQTVEGARAGMLLNSVTKELIDPETGIYLIPVFRRREYIEWRPRNAGGGLVDFHQPNSEVVAAALKANGGVAFGGLKVGENELVETLSTYCLQYDPETLQPLGYGIISASSTKIKPYKDWSTALYMLVPKAPLFANRTHLTTVKQKNEKGSFYNFKFSPAGENWKAGRLNPADELQGALYGAAKSFHTMISDGMVQADFGSQREQSGQAADGETPF